MHRPALRAPNKKIALRSIAPLLLSIGCALAGCTSSPIGDPCVPESIPETGFDPREIYLETSSVQCRTRVCMVYQLDGNPNEICRGDGTDGPNCVQAEDLEDQVFCTCRCSIPAGVQANTPLCSCADGFTCVDDIVTAGTGAEGRQGVAGGYCVPCITGADDDRGLDPALFTMCPTESGS
jgi:hypothetical protein